MRHGLPASVVGLILAGPMVAAPCGPECALSEENRLLLRSPGVFRLEVDTTRHPEEPPPAPLPFPARQLELELTNLLEREGVPLHRGEVPGAKSRPLILEARVWLDDDGYSCFMRLSPEIVPSGSKGAMYDEVWPTRLDGPIEPDALRATLFRHARAMGRELARLYREAADRR